MKYITPGNYNEITYYSRYNQIHKWEIYDHSTKIEVSGNTFIYFSGDTTGSTTYLSGDGIITHIIDYVFTVNNLYSYKAYYNLNYEIENTEDEYYLSSHLLLSTDEDNKVIKNFNDIPKIKNTYKIRK